MQYTQKVYNEFGGNSQRYSSANPVKKVDNYKDKKSYQWTPVKIISNSFISSNKPLTSRAKSHVDFLENLTRYQVNRGYQELFKYFKPQKYNNNWIYQQYNNNKSVKKNNGSSMSISSEIPDSLTSHEKNNDIANDISSVPIFKSKNTKHSAMNIIKCKNSNYSATKLEPENISTALTDSLSKIKYTSNDNPPKKKYNSIYQESQFTRLSNEFTNRSDPQMVRPKSSIAKFLYHLGYYKLNQKNQNNTININTKSNVCPKLMGQNNKRTTECLGFNNQSNSLIYKKKPANYDNKLLDIVDITSIRQNELSVTRNKNSIQEEGISNHKYKFLDSEKNDSHNECKFYKTGRTCADNNEYILDNKNNIPYQINITYTYNDKNLNSNFSSGYLYNNRSKRNIVDCEYSSKRNNVNSLDYDILTNEIDIPHQSFSLAHYKGFKRTPYNNSSYISINNQKKVYLDSDVLLKGEVSKEVITQLSNFSSKNINDSSLTLNYAYTEKQNLYSNSENTIQTSKDKKHYVILNVNNKVLFSKEKLRYDISTNENIKSKYYLKSKDQEFITQQIKFLLENSNDVEKLEQKLDLGETQKTKDYLGEQSISPRYGDSFSNKKLLFPPIRKGESTILEINLPVYNSKINTDSNINFEYSKVYSTKNTILTRDNRASSEVYFSSNSPSRNVETQEILSVTDFNNSENQLKNNLLNKSKRIIFYSRSISPMAQKITLVQSQLLSKASTWGFRNDTNLELNQTGIANINISHKNNNIYENIELNRTAFFDNQDIISKVSLPSSKKLNQDILDEDYKTDISFAKNPSTDDVLIKQNNNRDNLAANTIKNINIFVSDDERKSTHKVSDKFILDSMNKILPQSLGEKKVDTRIDQLRSLFKNNLEKIQSIVIPNGIDNEILPLKDNVFKEDYNQSEDSNKLILTESFKYKNNLKTLKSSDSYINSQNNILDKKITKTVDQTLSINDPKNITKLRSSSNIVLDSVHKLNNIDSRRSKYKNFMAYYEEKQKAGNGSVTKEKVQNNLFLKYQPYIKSKDLSNFSKDIWKSKKGTSFYLDDQREQDNLINIDNKYHYSNVSIPIFNEKKDNISFTTTNVKYSILNSIENDTKNKKISEIMKDVDSINSNHTLDTTDSSLIYQPNIFYKNHGDIFKVDHDYLNKEIKSSQSLRYDSKQSETLKTKTSYISDGNNLGIQHNFTDTEKLKLDTPNIMNIIMKSQTMKKKENSSDIDRPGNIILHNKVCHNDLTIPKSLARIVNQMDLREDNIFSNLYKYNKETQILEKNYIDNLETVHLTSKDQNLINGLDTTTLIFLNKFKSLKEKLGTVSDHMYNNKFRNSKSYNTDSLSNAIDRSYLASNSLVREFYKLKNDTNQDSVAANKMKYKNLKDDTLINKLSDDSLKINKRKDQGMNQKSYPNMLFDSNDYKEEHYSCNTSYNSHLTKNPQYYNSSFHSDKRKQERNNRNQNSLKQIKWERCNLSSSTTLEQYVYNVIELPDRNSSFITDKHVGNCLFSENKFDMLNHVKSDLYSNSPKKIQLSKQYLESKDKINENHIKYNKTYDLEINSLKKSSDIITRKLSLNSDSSTYIITADDDDSIIYSDKITKKDKDLISRGQNVTEKQITTSEKVYEISNKKHKSPSSEYNIPLSYQSSNTQASVLSNKDIFSLSKSKYDISNNVENNFLEPQNNIFSIGKEIFLDFLPEKNHLNTIDYTSLKNDITAELERNINDYQKRIPSNINDEINLGIIPVTSSSKKNLNIKHNINDLNSEKILALNKDTYSDLIKSSKCLENIEVTPLNISESFEANIQQKKQKQTKVKNSEENRNHLLKPLPKSQSLKSNKLRDKNFTFSDKNTNNQSQSCKKTMKIKDISKQGIISKISNEFYDNIKSNKKTTKTNGNSTTRNVEKTTTKTNKDKNIEIFNESDLSGLDTFVSHNSKKLIDHKRKTSQLEFAFKPEYVSEENIFVTKSKLKKSKTTKSPFSTNKKNFILDIRRGEKTLSPKKKKSKAQARTLVLPEDKLNTLSNKKSRTLNIKNRYKYEDDSTIDNKNKIKLSKTKNINTKNTINSLSNNKTIEFSKLLNKNIVIKNEPEKEQNKSKSRTNKITENKKESIALKPLDEIMSKSIKTSITEIDFKNGRTDRKVSSTSKQANMKTKMIRSNATSNKDLKVNNSINLNRSKNQVSSKKNLKNDISKEENKSNSKTFLKVTDTNINRKSTKTTGNKTSKDTGNKTSKTTGNKTSKDTGNKTSKTTGNKTSKDTGNKTFKSTLSKSSKDAKENRKDSKILSKTQNNKSKKVNLDLKTKLSKTSKT